MTPPTSAPPEHDGSDPLAPCVTPQTGRANFAEFLWLWNVSQGLGLPQIHRRMARFFERGLRTLERRMLLLSFRGSGKSTVAAAFAAWLLYRNPNLRVLVVSAEHGLATKLVRHTRQVVAHHPLSALRDGRDHRTRLLWRSDQFTVPRSMTLRDPSALALGVRANATGSRADVVICDDVEVPNTSHTALAREELRRRLGELDFIVTPKGVQIYLGTPHAAESIYYGSPAPSGAERETDFLENFQRLRIPVTDGRGRPAWSDVFPIERVERLRRGQGARRFLSQMMMVPISAEEPLLRADRVRIYDADLRRISRGGAEICEIMDVPIIASGCHWDPAFARAGGDASVLACVFFDRQSTAWIHHVQTLTVDAGHHNDEAGQQCAQVLETIDRLGIASISVETNGLGAFLPGLLRHAIRTARLRCAVTNSFSRTAKTTRIVQALVPRLSARRVMVHKDVWSGRFGQEFAAWQPTKNSRDDALDAVSGALLDQPTPFPSASSPGEFGKTRSGVTQLREVDFRVF